LAYVELSIQQLEPEDLDNEEIRDELKSLTSEMLSYGIQTGRDEVLFGTVFERFVDFGAKTVFFDALTPFILSGQLQSTLNPTVVNGFFFPLPLFYL